MRVFGFSLIELLVALVVLALLSAVAVPIYVQYADRTFRREAQADLLRCAQGMERLASVNFSYANAADSNGDGVGDALVGPVATAVCAGTSPERYRLSVAASATDYVLTATPIGPMAGSGVLTFDSAGRRAWDRDADGAVEPDAGENSWD